jgi:two-component system, OmpR family, phosphate regulon sensor histidine kinase PhoR
MAIRPAAAPGDGSRSAADSHPEPLAGNVSAFLDLVTHDLRAPIASVRMMVSVLSHGYVGELLPKQADLVGRIERRLASLQALVDDLIDLASLRGHEDAGRCTDLCAAARAACARRGADAETPAQVLLEAAPGVVEVAIDPADLDLVLRHLVDNAIKYGAGHDVRVRVDRLEDHARLVVADAGIGIPDEAKPHVCEPLFRGAGAQAVAPGSGLGLAIVKEAVERCNGAVAIESAEGAGTTVTVRLPLAGPG